MSYKEENKIAMVKGFDGTINIEKYINQCGSQKQHFTSG